MSPVPFRAVQLSVAALAALALLCGCQRAGNPIAGAIEHAVRGQGETGAAVGPRAHESLALPASFPGDVYLPRGYRVNSAMDLRDASVLSLSAPGHVDALFAEAREAMRADGWIQTLAARHSADTAVLGFEKTGADGARSATLSFNRNHGDARVIVGVRLRRHP
ncbi:MAG TPA: hypothetical protein VK000_10690 [Luteimonas sp.]|nr:hypothetical protein [Luteimonas sp.]